MTRAEWDEAIAGAHQMGVAELMSQQYRDLLAAKPAKDEEPSKE